jgi:hypothetical protein
MKHQNLLKFAFLFSFPLLLINCGGGGGSAPNNGGMGASSDKAIGSLSTLSSSMVVADKAFRRRPPFFCCDQYGGHDSQEMILKERMNKEMTPISKLHLRRESGRQLFDHLRLHGERRSPGPLPITSAKASRETCTRADGTGGIILSFDGTGTYLRPMPGGEMR